jgi:hypothetical protein
MPTLLFKSSPGDVKRSLVLDLLSGVTTTDRLTSTIRSIDKVGRGYCAFVSEIINSYRESLGVQHTFTYKMCLLLRETILFDNITNTIYTAPAESNVFIYETSVKCQNLVFATSGKYSGWIPASSVAIQVFFLVLSNNSSCLNLNQN